MKKITTIFSLLLLHAFSDTSAQSVALYGGSASGKSIASGGIDADGADSLYIGAGTHTIDGTWEIYSTWVMIDPAAVISGTGTIVFKNPSLGFGSSTATKLDMNNITTAITTNLQIDNDQSVTISELPWAAELTSSGWTQSTTDNSVNLAADLNFNADGGHLVLGSTVKGDLHLTSSGTLSGFRPARYVVTNNAVTSHLKKDAFTTFTFPVGRTATSDYTPAQIVNTSSNTVSVSVQDYAASTSVETLTDGTVNTADGMDRTWHIFASSGSIGANVILQHNNATNQNGFDASTNFVTQWSNTTPNTTGDRSVPFSSSAWQTNTPKSSSVGALSTAGTVSGSNVNDRNYAALPTSISAPESYFSKSSDAIHPLPLQLLTFTAKAETCGTQLNWTTGVEDGMLSMELQRSADGNQFTTLTTALPKGTSSSYAFYDQRPLEGANLYRIRLNTRSGSYTYSSIVKVNMNCDTKMSVANIKVAPNPVAGILSVTNIPVDPTQSENWHLRLIDMYGRMVLEQLARSEKELIDVSQLAQGTYVLQVVEGDMIQSNIRIQKQ